MAKASTLVDPYGRPIERARLTEEKAGPTLRGVRSVLTGYPGNGLTPERLASILRSADQGDPLRYLELVEIVEERDLHFAGVLGTRKRSVSQLEILVDAASDASDHIEQADRIRTWLLRDELQGELFDMLDAVGKGFSVTEILWDTSSGSWEPKRLEYRDPRWFTFDQRDGATLLLRTDTGDVPLDPYCYITPVMRAKSGLPIRSGLGRLAVWFWMFKSFTQRDWAIFTQTYGQPIRVGKYGRDATEKEKDILFSAVANIAGDCAAIVPDSMLIEFVEAKSLGTSSALYRERCDWLDQQISKAVLGQTATTDAIAGGHAVGREHRQVQEDIERADAIALSAVLNRDLVRPWIDLEYGPQAKGYPRLRIGRREEKDIAGIVAAVEKLVPMGLRVQVTTMTDLLGLPEPDKGAEVLMAPRPPAPVAVEPPRPGLAPVRTARQQVALQAPVAGDAIDVAVADLLAEDGWEALVAPIVDGLADRLGAATTIEEARSILAMQIAAMEPEMLGELLARAAFAARLAGEADEPLADL